MRAWRKIMAAGTVAASMAMAGSVATGSASAAEPYCGIAWGSLPKQAPQTPRVPGTVVDVRAGRHSCFDRLVVDVDGRAYDYWVQYVDQVRIDGSGTVVPLEGGAKLHVGGGAGAFDMNADPTFAPADASHVVDVTGYRTFRQVAWAGAMEGRTTVGLGVRARLPFRVFVLEGPGSGSRLVVDVAHRW